jgi:hypothetical protein
MFLFKFVHYKKGQVNLRPIVGGFATKGQKSSQTLKKSCLSSLSLSEQFADLQLSDWHT